MRNLYNFESCDYAEDFECLVDVHNYHDWFPEGLCDVWLKAYDTSCCETAKERELHDAGYAFECYVWLSTPDNCKITTNMEHRPAMTREEAEDMLVKMAERAMNDKYVVETLKKLAEEEL